MLLQPVGLGAQIAGLLSSHWTTPALGGGQHRPLLAPNKLLPVQSVLRWLALD